MNRTLLGSFLGAYFIFVFGTIAIDIYCPAFLLPGAIILSLIPIAFFYHRFYHPFSKIVIHAKKQAAGESQEMLPYSFDDELGQLSASLNYLAESVQNSDQYQRSFISNISHDFRSPLTSIKGYVEAILDGTIPPEYQGHYLNVVLSETERLNKLTEGLLTLNNFDDQGIYLDFTDFDLIPVLHQLTETFEGISNRKNINLNTVYSSPSIYVHADMGKIQQVLYNLIDNAIKFSYNDSEISIRVTENKNRVFISVKDNGEGIAKENIPKIWNRFYKTDSSRGKDKKGTGLGLSIVKEIIRAHDTNIDVISTEGVGTEFVFALNKGEQS